MVQPLKSVVTPLVTVLWTIDTQRRTVILSRSRVRCSRPTSVACPQPIAPKFRAMPTTIPPNILAKSARSSHICGRLQARTVAVPRLMLVKRPTSQPTKACEPVTNILVDNAHTLRGLRLPWVPYVGDEQQPTRASHRASLVQSVRKLR